VYNISVEMPSGALSIGYDYDDVVRAEKTFARVVAQLKAWPLFIADVVLMENRTEIQREKINVPA
jgi:hypothetical protein